MVGPEKKSFRLHKSLLCHASKYFDAALNGGFKEAEEEKIEMLGDCAEMFKHFQFWLYSNTINMSTNKRFDIEWKQLIDLFIFGEARGIPNLMNCAIDGLIDKQAYMFWTPLDQIPYIYDNTAPKSPLRQLLVDLVIRDSNFHDDSWFSEVTFQWTTKEFLSDLAVAQCEFRRGVRSVADDFKATRRDYHVLASD